MRRTDAKRGSTSNGQGNAPALIGDFAPTDPADQEYATFPWEILISPASRGPYRHRLKYVAMRSLIMYWERYDTPVRVRGLTPANHLSLALPLLIGFCVVRAVPSGTGWSRWLVDTG